MLVALTTPDVVHLHRRAGFPSESALRLPANWTGTPSTADSDAHLPTR
ncbi:hypothetical protein [Mycobacterium lehmannii]|nr:hypothetical protein [Mycobacterium lehmannii]